MTETYSNKAQTTLTASLTAVATAIPVASTATFPATGQFSVIIGAEYLIATVLNATTLTALQRGSEGSTPASHPAGAAVTWSLTKRSLDALLAQTQAAAVAEAIAGAGDCGVPSVVWQPGVATASGHVNTFAEVAAWIAPRLIALIGPLLVYVDDASDPGNAAIVPAATDLELQGRVWFVAANPRSSVGTTYLNFEDGARIRNPAGFIGVSVYGAPLAVMPVRVDIPGHIVTFRDAAWVYEAAAGGVALFDVAAGAQFSCDGEVSFGSDDLDVPLIQVAAATNLTLVMRGGTQSISSAIPTNLVGGAADSTLLLMHTAELTFTTQPAFAGTVTVRRLMHAEAIEPSRGTTAQRPASPIAGQLYHDTDLSTEVLWSGTVWIVLATRGYADGVAAAAQAAAEAVANAKVASVSGSGPIVSSGGTTPTISITAATQTDPGSMSAADKAKLDAVEAGAQVTNWTRVAAALGGQAAGADKVFVSDAGGSGAMATAWSGGTLTNPTLAGTVTLSATSMQATGNARSRPYSDVANVQTSDATVTSLFTWTVLDEAATMAVAEVLADKNDGSVTAAYARRVRIKRDATVVTVGTVEDSYTSEEAGFAACDVTIDASGATGRVRVTGIAATTIDWGGVVSRLEVSHA